MCLAGVATAMQIYWRFKGGAALDQQAKHAGNACDTMWKPEKIRQGQGSGKGEGDKGPGAILEDDVPTCKS